MHATSPPRVSQPAADPPKLHVKQHLPLGQALPPLHCLGVYRQVSKQPQLAGLFLVAANADDIPATSAIPIIAAAAAPVTPARRRKLRRLTPPGRTPSECW